MNKPAVQRQSRPLLPDLSELLAGLPTFTGTRPLLDKHVIRVEHEHSDGLYQLHAELPGVDPVEGIEVSVLDGQLTIKAQRRRESDVGGRSEFAYGSFTREVTLPAGADEDGIDATYDRGILTISVPVDDGARTEKLVEVVEIVTLAGELEDFDEPDDDTEGTTGIAQETENEPENVTAPEGQDNHEPVA